MDLHIITDLAELEELRPDWDELVQHSDSTIFQSFGWNYAWARHLAERLRILLAYEGDRLVGIAPLCYQKNKLVFIGTPHSDYSDFILHAGREQQILPHLFSEIASMGSFAHLMEIPQSSPALAFARDKGIGIVSHISDRFSFTGGDLSKVMKRRKKMKVFVERGDLTLRPAIEEHEFSIFYKKMKEQHIRRWKETATPSHFQDPKVQAFYDSFYGQAFRSGNLRLYGLFLREELISVQLVLVHGDVHYGYTLTYDPDHRSLSPGIANALLSFKSSLGEGISRFDFGRGDGEHKKELGNAQGANYEIEIPVGSDPLFKLKKRAIQGLRSNRPIYNAVMGARENARYRIRKLLGEQ